MSDKKVYSIFDVVTKSYMTPFYVAVEGQAFRIFTDIVNNPEKNTDISRNPGQFALFYLGEFDDQTGKFSSGTPEEKLMGHQVVAEEEKYSIQELIKIINEKIK